MIDCVLVDLDGTLADCSHRRHFVEGEKKDWDSFLAPERVAADLLNEAVARVVRALEFSCRIMFVSGRDESLRDVTMTWLRKYNFSLYRYSALRMRKVGDKRPDTVIKSEILAEIRELGYNPILALDDRNSVVDMWRSEGVPCFQVAEGDF